MDSGLVLWWHNRITACLLDNSRFIDKNQLWKVNPTINTQSYIVHRLVQFKYNSSLKNPLNPSPKIQPTLRKPQQNCKNWWNGWKNLLAWKKPVYWCHTVWDPCFIWFLIDVILWCQMDVNDVTITSLLSFPIGSSLSHYVTLLQSHWLSDFEYSHDFVILTCNWVSRPQF